MYNCVGCGLKVVFIAAQKLSALVLRIDSGLSGPNDADPLTLSEIKPRVFKGFIRMGQWLSCPHPSEDLPGLSLKLQYPVGEGEEAMRSGFTLESTTTSYHH